jgi:molybdopterin-guanine dinucleotide biosynthesis protein A
MISANRNTAAYAALGYPVWPDELEGFAGPLAGLQSGLAHCTTPWLLTAPCDAPFLPLDLGQRLAAGLLAQRADIAVAVTGAGTARRREPVFCLLKTALLPSLTAYLAGGGRKVDGWLETLNVAETAFSDPAEFRNINTPQDLQRHDQA